MNARSIPTDQPRTVSTYSLLSEGEAVPRTVQVLSFMSHHEVGRIPLATLVLKDGEPAAQTFAVSTGPEFAPGRNIEVKLGFRGSEEPVFSGIVVRQSIKVMQGGSLLIVDLKDKTEKMTALRASRYFHDATDSDIIEQLIDAHGLTRDVEATEHRHVQFVQHHASDWDVLCCRAEAAGKLVFVRDGQVQVKAPAFSAEPKLAIQFGATVYELDASLDARLQYHGVTATTWNQADQAVSSDLEATRSEAPDPGNLSPDALADLFSADPYRLVHGAALPDAEVQGWIEGMLLRHRLAKICGKVTVDGTSAVRAGDLIELSGVGERFSGKLFVTGVAQALQDGAWKSTFQFGLDPAWFVQRFVVEAPRAGGLLPAIAGLQIGIVVALADDPDGEERIQVRLPVIHAQDQGAWCRLATLDAGQERGTCFRPELGDEVIVGFIDDDPRHGVVLGQLHSSARPPPIAAADDNPVKGYQSREKLRLTFDDQNKIVTIETPQGNRLTLSEQDGKVEIADQNDNTIIMDQSGIKLSSSGDIVLEASGQIKVSAQQTLELEGTRSAKVKSGMGAELSLGGTADLSAPMVNIN